MIIDFAVYGLLLEEILDRLIEGSDGVGGDWTVSEIRTYLKSIGIIMVKDL